MIHFFTGSEPKARFARASAAPRRLRSHAPSTHSERNQRMTVLQAGPAQARARHPVGHPARHREGKPAHAGERRARVDAASGGARFAFVRPHITTDFSESQLQLITGVHANAGRPVAEWTQIHQSLDRGLGDEMLRVGSMPCGLPTDETIPLGVYGSSNAPAPRASTAWGSGTASGAAHADDLGHPLQLVDAGHHDRAVLRADPQLPPPLVPAAVPVRRLAVLFLFELRRRARSRPAARRRHATSLRMGGWATRAMRRRRSP